MCGLNQRRQEWQKRNNLCSSSPSVSHAKMRQLCGQLPEVTRCEEERAARTVSSSDHQHDIIERSLPFLGMLTRWV